MRSVVLISPEEHFTELVKEACQHRQVKTPPDVEVYLVKLLNHYLQTRNLHQPKTEDLTEKQPDTFAEMYLQAMNTEGIKRNELMRIVADKSLYLTGFFADSFHRKIVDIDYYVEIGSAAYSNLSHWTRQDSMSELFETFSKRFTEFVEVLNYISEKSIVQSDENVLRLYDRYLRTGSDLAREKLNQMGVVTIPKEQLKLLKA